MSWLEEKGKSYADLLTIGDIMDLGFDPTRLKEILIDGTEYIFERVQARQVPALRKRNELLDRISQEMPNVKVKNAHLKTNPVLLIIQDRGNAYVLRRKMGAIHWEEALEQLQSNPRLKSLNATTKIDRIILKTIKEANETITEKLGLERGLVLDLLNPFVSWDLKNNQPKVVIDFLNTHLETAWMV
jgi:hypothetical protein